MMKSNRTIRRLLFIAALTMSVVMGQSVHAAGVKDVLEMIPDDAWGFAIAKSLDQVDATAAKLKDSLGLPLPAPVTPLALEPLQLGDSIDKASPVCAIMLNAQKMGGPDQAAVLLVPAKDPKAMLKNLGAEEAQEGISKVTIMGEAGFAAVRGKTVVLGPNQDAVQHVAKGKKSMAEKAAASRIKTIGECDLYVSVSVSSVLGAYKEMVMPMLQMAMAATDPQGKSAEQLVKMFEEMSSLDLGMKFDDNGLGLLCLMTPKPDSDLEKYIADEKGSDSSLLAVLPKDKYLFGMGLVVSHSDYSKKFGGDKSFSSVVKMLNIPGIDAKAVDALDTQFDALHKNLVRAAVSVSSLPEGSDGLIGVTVVAQTNEADKFVEDLRKVFASLQSISDDEDFKAIKKNVSLKSNAETIAGNKVDTIDIKLEEIAEATEGKKEEVEKIKKVLGKDVMVRFGAVGDKHVVVSFGGGKKRYETVAQAAKSSGGLSTDAGITEMSKLLPDKKLAEVYFAIDTILQTVKTVAKALGEDAEIPFDIPTINAPLAMSSAVQDTASRLDMVVPMKLIKAGKEAFDKYSKSAKDDFDDDDAGAKKDAKHGKKDTGHGDKDNDKDEDSDKDSGKSKDDGE